MIIVPQIGVYSRLFRGFPRGNPFFRVSDPSHRFLRTGLLQSSFVKIRPAGRKIVYNLSLSTFSADWNPVVFLQSCYSFRIRINKGVGRGCRLEVTAHSGGSSACYCSRCTVRFHFWLGGSRSSAPVPPWPPGARGLGCGSLVAARWLAGVLVFGLREVRRAGLQLRKPGTEPTAHARGGHARPASAPGGSAV